MNIIKKHSNILPSWGLTFVLGLEKSSKIILLFLDISKALSVYTPWVGVYIPKILEIFGLNISTISISGYESGNLVRNLLFFYILVYS